MSTHNANMWKTRAEAAEQKCAQLQTLAAAREAELKVLARKVARFRTVVDQAEAIQREFSQR